MSTITAFIKRHPARTYFVLAFAISWGGVLIVVAPGGSLLVAMLMHVSLTSSLIILRPPAAALWAVVAAVSVAERRVFSRQVP